MASIDTLVDDIYALIASGEAEFRHEPFKKDVQKPMLRMSNFATPDKQLWFAINRPDLAEEMPPWALFKFNYGHILEDVVLDLAEQAGHTVEGRQDEREYCGLKGHMDAIIDGVLIDVKSANSRSFDKFKQHRLADDDAFGYLDQLSLYLLSSRDDERVKVKDRGAFLAIDKELGHLCLDWYKKKEVNYEKEIERKLQLLGEKSPPHHCCNSIAMGSSGNLRLGVRCSYNPYKWACHPELRAFQYSYGPVYLTKVVRTPDVPEITEQYINLKYR